MRQRLTRRPSFSFSEAFTEIDSNNNGYLTKDEMGKFLEKNEFFATNKEMD